MRSLSDVEDDSPVTFMISPLLDESVDRSRLQEKTHRILAQLHEPYGLMFLWRYWERRSARQMAEATGQDRESNRAFVRARGLNSSGGGCQTERPGWIEICSSRSWR